MLWLRGSRSDLEVIRSGRANAARVIIWVLGLRDKLPSYQVGMVPYLIASSPIFIAFKEIFHFCRLF